MGLDVAPGREARVVVLKGTFDLVAGGAAGPGDLRGIGVGPNAEIGRAHV